MIFYITHPAASPSRLRSSGSRQYWSTVGVTLHRSGTLHSLVTLTLLLLLLFMMLLTLSFSIKGLLCVLLRRSILSQCNEDAEQGSFPDDMPTNNGELADGRRRRTETSLGPRVSSEGLVDDISFSRTPLADYTSSFTLFFSPERKQPTCVLWRSTVRGDGTTSQPDGGSSRCSPPCSSSLLPAYSLPNRWILSQSNANAVQGSCSQRHKIPRLP